MPKGVRSTPRPADWVNPLKGRPNPKASRPLADRFWEKVDKSAPNGCWVWTGARTHGHGTIHVAMPNKLDYTHRVVFGLLGQEIPEGMQVDHICRNRLCCNPDHLRFVTRDQNVVENSLSPSALNKAKYYCKRGHPLAGENLRLNRRGHRSCIARDKLRPSYIKRLRGTNPPLREGGSE